MLQGDRKAGPSLSAFNYESTWGQKALKRFYRVVLGVSPFQPVRLTHLIENFLGSHPSLHLISALAYNAAPCTQICARAWLKAQVS